MYGLFNNKYSGIITKGLGLPACSGMITMFFGVFAIEVLPPQPPGGGGGHGGGAIGGKPGVSSPGFYTPAQIATTRIVRITVNMKEHQWQKSYALDIKKAAILVDVLDFVNVIKQRTNIAFGKLKHITKKVVATFTDKYNKEE